MRCGCKDDNEIGLDDEECVLPEAIDLIRELLMTSAWNATAANMKAEAFIKKVTAE
jgi:hypothetical protein